jgi:CheY-like chemotaxis protein
MEKKNEPETILIVDDEPENRRIYAEILNDLGFKTIEEPDGESALSVVKEGITIDLVIADYRMPKMNGLQFIESLRELLPSVPMIMVTAFANVESYLQSFSLGVFEYMNKPFSKAEFVRIVKAALGASGKEAA